MSKIEPRRTLVLTGALVLLGLAGCGKPAAVASSSTSAPAPAATTSTVSTSTPVSTDRLCDLIQASFKDVLPPDPKRNTRITNSCTVGGGPIGQPRVAQVRVSYSTFGGTTPDELKFMRNNDPKTKDAPALGAGSFSSVYAGDTAMAKLGFTTAKNGRLLIIEIEPARALTPADTDKATTAAKALFDAL